MNKILIISEKENDLTNIILKYCCGAKVYSYKDYNIPFEKFDSVCVLGGTEKKPLTLPAKNRVKIEKMAKQGKRVFYEFVASIDCIHQADITKTTHHRLVYSNEQVEFANLAKGDILDGHYNELITYLFLENGKNVLTYHDYICAHDHIDMDFATFNSGKPALFFLKNNILISAFRICNFNRARFAPMENWKEILKSVIEFIAGEKVEFDFPKPVCTLSAGEKVENPEDVNRSVKKGLEWFKNANILIDNGENGVYEGFSHFVSAENGKQEFLEKVRADCTGEVGGAYLLDYMVTGNKESYEIFKNTEAFIFEYMQIKEGEHKGMVRWTEGAWEVCYQDDVARAILPTLLAMNFGIESKYSEDVKQALDYLVETTDEDGLRVARTECITLTEERENKIKKAGAGTPCAHYNAYYHMVLILATRAGLGEKYANIGVKGLTSIMNKYPETKRETSETEEMCRLVLPLSVLYEYTKDDEHKSWLYKVVKDMERLQHKSFGYAEWDTGYKAVCARNDKGECALLANNNDPVADLLYSNNWLPMAFSYAYMVTKDEMFYKKWQEIATFMVSAQISSNDILLNGAWARALDMNRMEIYGVPHDVGWAPCCMESGWTVAEILMGLQFMTVVKKETFK
ncbi:MAG: hypothetical protein J6A69_12465 [Clostridia bacterium]|nr:hypothetical protein [Clostridia bacterium]